MCLDFLYEPFNIGTHKANAHKIDGFEVMIAPDGTVEYAMPSHQEFLIKKSAQIKGVTRQELEDSCPEEYYGDYMHWLMEAIFQFGTNFILHTNQLRLNKRTHLKS